MTMVVIGKQYWREEAKILLLNDWGGLFINIG